MVLINMVGTDIVTSQRLVGDGIVNESDPESIDERPTAVECFTRVWSLDELQATQPTFALPNSPNSSEHDKTGLKSPPWS